MKQVESEFFQSDYYMDLRRRIEAGTTIKPAEWKDLEQRLKVIYPHFSSSLYGHRSHRDCFCALQGQEHHQQHPQTPLQEGF